MENNQVRDAYLEGARMGFDNRFLDKFKDPGSTLFNVFNYDLSMMKIRQNSHDISPSPAVDEVTDLHLKKRKAPAELISSKNKTPVLFDVFNYGTSMMKPYGCSEVANRPSLSSISVLSEKENISPQHQNQAMSRKEDVFDTPFSKREPKAFLKRKPLSVLNGHPLNPLNETLGKNISIQQQALYTANKGKPAEVKKTYHSPQLKESRTLDGCKRKFIAPSASNNIGVRNTRLKTLISESFAEKTPKSTLCSVFSSPPGSSTTVEKDCKKKKSFESIPQALNFDMGKDTTHNDHCLEDAGMYMDKLYKFSIKEPYDNLNAEFLNDEDPWCKERMANKAKGV
uniref:Uncharacterized protein n=1 Tax=Daucus carota subsp. sativus TaxID=79200 RepID=A0A164ZG09_DAUCS